MVGHIAKLFVLDADAAPGLLFVQNASTSSDVARILLRGLAAADWRAAHGVAQTGLLRRSAGSPDAVSNGADVRLLHDRRSWPIRPKLGVALSDRKEFYVRAL
jgi:hypothetical protein